MPFVFYKNNGFGYEQCGIFTAPSPESQTKFNPNYAIENKNSFLLYSDKELHLFWTITKMVYF